jgi:transposase InsO family protein
MDRDVERFISECETCRRGTIRRRHLKMIFDPHAPSARALPRQHYGLDFYGVHKGEILVIIDLFTREVILEHLSSRSQLKVAATLLKHVIMSRGVPVSFRTDNAPELMRGAVEIICQFFEHRTDHHRWT